MYALLPFRFGKFKDQYIMTNDVGEFLFLSKDNFQNLINNKIDINSNLFYNLQSKFFATNKENIEHVKNILATRYLTKKSFLLDFTALHMVVPTLRCNSNCIYCQVSSKSDSQSKYCMNKETAESVVNTIFESPSKNIKIEFQGGEPLLNFEIVKYIIQYAEKLNKTKNKNIEFVICTNLTLIDKNILNFLKTHNVYISTSLDGAKNLHDRNRPLRNEQSSYDLFIEKLHLTREILGVDRVSALMTSTKTSLEKINEIIDEYISHGFHSIFLRMLNPYGRATELNDELRYSVTDFFESYKIALNYIIQTNINGYFFVEEFANIILRKILTPFSSHFVDLQSPPGIGISCAIYNYNGNVYASDEGRMLAEMGDENFLLGNVTKNTHKEIFGGEYLKSLIENSISETSPLCAYCPYLPYCGLDPVRNYVEGNKMINSACEKNKLIIEFLLELIQENKTQTMDVFWSWLTNRSIKGFGIA